MSTKSPNVKMNIIDFDQQPWDEDANENVSIADSIFGQFFGIPNFMGVWKNSASYQVNQVVVDAVDGTQWTNNVSHLSIAAPTSFATERSGNPSYWTQTGSSSAANAASAAASAAQAQQNVGRNLLHNSMFRVQQRGAGPFSTNGAYTADRWQLQFSNGTVSVQTFPMAVNAIPGDESAETQLGCSFTGGAGASDFLSILQKIEDVRRLGNKTVTLSFWAIAQAGTPKLGCNLAQFFGTGGSPSATVQVAGQAVTLTTGWAHYSLTFALPSVLAKTLGSNGNDFTQVVFWYSCGSSNAFSSGNVPVQSNNITLWGVQLEIGSVATQLEKPDFEREFANCQRFYQVGDLYYIAYTGAGSTLGVGITTPVQMRGTAILTPTFTTQTNCSGSTLVMQTRNFLRLATTVTALGAVVLTGSYTASADL